MKIKKDCDGATSEFRDACEHDSSRSETHAAQPPSHVNILCLIATAVSGHSQSGQLQKVRPIQGSSHHYDSPPGKDYVDTEKNSSNSVNSPQSLFYLISPSVQWCMEDSTWRQNKTFLLPVTIFKNGFRLVSKKKCRWCEGPAASWCLWAPPLSHRVFDILSCDWYGATAKRRKRKVSCRACHQAFRCGMWNFLSLFGFSYICSVVGTSW